MKKKINYFNFAINLIKLAIGIFIIYYLVYKIGIGAIIDSFTKIEFAFIPLILLVYAMNFVLGALNIAVLLSPFKHKATLKDLTIYNIYSWSLGLISPGKVGEFSLVFFLKKKSVSYDKGIAIAYLDKIITFLMFGLVAAVGFFIFFKQNAYLALIIILLCTLIMLCAIFFKSTVVSFLSFFKFKAAKKLKQFYLAFHESSTSYFKKHKGLLLLNCAFTLLKLLIMSLVIWLAFLGFGEDVNFWMVCIVNATAIIISLIPITISGLGISQAVSIYLFNLIGISPAISLSVAVLTLVINYAIAFISIMLFHVRGLRYVFGLTNSKNKK